MKTPFCLFLSTRGGANWELVFWASRTINWGKQRHFDYFWLPISFCLMIESILWGFLRFWHVSWQLPHFIFRNFLRIIHKHFLFLFILKIRMISLSWKKNHLVNGHWTLDIWVVSLCNGTVEVVFQTDKWAWSNINRFLSHFFSYSISYLYNNLYKRVRGRTL